MDVHPRIRHEPDPDHPGWWSWELDDDTRFNAVIGKLLVRADGPGRAICRMFPKERHANLGDMDAGRDLPVHCHWHDVARGVAERFDAIVCNPPFHALGRGERPDIGRAFIASAADALKPGGRLWLVANRHLPYEQALGEGFAQMRTVAQQRGFKIVEATKAAR